MKPTFALDLTRDSIALLHRTPKGWLSIGEVAFDTPDLSEALDYLRKTALGLSPLGFATKIILPNSQILYTEIEAPGPSRNDKRRQIAAALEGRTPYAVEDLVFDWSGKGATVKVAVVARETLEEAEEFAVRHRLNPVSFVAIPEDGAFVGEPWFGPTVAADSILAPGEGVDRDREAVTILLRDLPVSTPDPSPAEVAPDEVAGTTPSPLPDTKAAPADTTPEDEPLPGLDEALNADLPEPAPTARPEPEAEPEPEPGPGAEPATAASASVTIATPATATADDDLPADPLREPARDEPTPAASPDVAPASASPAPRTEIEEAPFAHVTDSAAFPDGDDILPLPPGLKSEPGKADRREDDIPPAPPSAAMVAFASRRAAGGAPASTPLGAVTRPGTGTLPPPPASGARLGKPIARPAVAKGTPGLVTAPTIPGTRTKTRGKPGGIETGGLAATGPTTIRSPTRPGGTFGTAAPPRNRTGVVFMVMVALLLICLALVAAWSSFYLARSSDPAVGPESDPAVASLNAIPDVDDEMLADLQDPAELAALPPETSAADTTVDTAPVDAGLPAAEPPPVNIGGVAEESVAETSATALPEAGPEDGPDGGIAPVAERRSADGAGPDAAAAVASAPDSAPEPAPATAVTTELATAQAPAEDQDEIFLSAMDAPPPALDALALPTPVAVADTAPDRPMPPPAFGTVYQFGPDGLLRPTPEGILSPDGVMLFAGKPPRLPPPRSEVAIAAALAAASEAAAPDEPEVAVEGAATPAPSAADASLVTAGEAQAVEPVPSDPAMAGFRPRPRPADLAPETDDDAALAVEPASDFAGLRPLPRPEIVLAAAAAAAPAPADLGARAASLAAQAEAQLAAAAALEAQNPSIVAISKRPQGRPRDLSRAVEAAVAAAVREAAPAPEPEVVAAAAAAPALKPEELEEVDEPDVVVAAPKIPTKANVAKQATFTKALNLKRVNLIGTYGTDSRRTALIRQANGRYVKVKVGDKIDGGTIKAITETEVRYQKGGKLLALTMPKS
jgi:hypothetical protein